MIGRFVIAGVVALVTAQVAVAQPVPAMRVAGMVEGFDGHVLAVKSDKLGDVKINLTNNVVVFGVSKATLADVKPALSSASAPCRSRMVASAPCR